MAGRSIEELKEILGHYSVVVTERYAHLRPDLFAPGAHSALVVDLTRPDEGFSTENAQKMPILNDGSRVSIRNNKQNAGAAL